jgi:uncharacterized protein YndB with AHSA1/START domain
VETYHFVTNWYFRAPIDRVWATLTDVKAWPAWWPSWKRAEFRGPELLSQPGSIVDNEVKGSLPYSLRFTTEVTLIQPPERLEIRSSGDLVGSGSWVLERRDDGTAVTYTWDVGTANPVFNVLGKLSFVRAMIEKNHDFVMDEGFRGLKQRVEQ